MSNTFISDLYSALKKLCSTGKKEGKKNKDIFVEINKDPSKKVESINVKTSEFRNSIKTTTVNRNSNNKIETIVVNQYNNSGSIVQTLTTTLNRDSSGKVISIQLKEN